MVGGGERRCVTRLGGTATACRELRELRESDWKRGRVQTWGFFGDLRSAGYADWGDAAGAERTSRLKVGLGPKLRIMPSVWLVDLM